jgi:iron-sulfur cluster insertion protein
MITVTEKAMEKINALLQEEGNPDFKVRAFVTGGGCSGFNYGFTFEENKDEDDFEVGGIIVDSMSMQYLQGAIIDWEDSVMSSQFVIRNPNATATCGCGKSFAV